MAQLAQVMNIKVNPETQQQLNNLNLPAGILASADRSPELRDEPPLATALQEPEQPAFPSLPLPMVKPDAARTPIQNTFSVLLAHLLKEQEKKRQTEAVADPCEATKAKLQEETQKPRRPPSPAPMGIC